MNKMIQNSQKSSKDDSIRAYRQNKKCITIRFGLDEYKKLHELSTYCTTRRGNSNTAIIRAILNNDRIIARHDEISAGHVGKAIGLFKYATTVFQFKLDVSKIIGELDHIKYVLIHLPDMRVWENIKPAIYNEYNDTKRRVGVYLDEETYQKLKDTAKNAGKTLSGYIRSKIAQKRIPTRLTPETAQEIVELGKVLKIVIDERDDKDIINIIELYSNLIIVIKEELGIL